METFNITGIIAISIIQLVYIYILHFTTKREIATLEDELKSSQIQLMDKTCIIKELQDQIEKP